jgi:hypothetical protein
MRQEDENKREVFALHLSEDKNGIELLCRRLQKYTSVTTRCFVDNTIWSLK